MKTTHKERINQLIDALGLSKNKFAKAVGTSSAVISNITTANVNYGIELAEKIISTFPSVNPSWLLSGIGEMMLPEQGSDSPLVSPSIHPSASSGSGEHPILTESNRIKTNSEARLIGGEQQKRWAKMRLLEIQLQKQHPEIDSDALRLCWLASDLGKYSDQLLGYVDEKTKIEIDKVLDQAIDKKISKQETVKRISHILKPVEELEPLISALEQAVVAIHKATRQLFPEVKDVLRNLPVAFAAIGEWDVEESGTVENMS